MLNRTFTLTLLGSLWMLGVSGFSLRDDNEEVQPKEKIVGGNLVTIDQVPYQAALFRYVTPDFIYPACGGSLISKTFVLTAAHCYYEK